MKSKLHTVEHLRTVLATTEPLNAIPFTVGDMVHFDINPGWHHGIEAKSPTDTVEASVTLGRTPVQLTKGAILEAASTFGLPRTYVEKCPAELLAPQLNYWWRNGMMTRTPSRRDFQLLTTRGIGSAFTRQSLQPFSNLALLDQVLAGVQEKYGNAEVLVDYKLTHNLRRTVSRIIIPHQRREITGSGTTNDEWSVGLQWKNSLVGEFQTAIEGYLFRWTCTNGQIDTRANSGTWTRRSGASEQEVYTWARYAVDEVLGGLEPALDAVQATTTIPIEGDVSATLRDIFEHYRVPVAHRVKIIELVTAHEGPLTMYALMNAITQVANEFGMEPAHVENLMRMGGDLPHAATSRCGACRRLMHVH